MKKFTAILLCAAMLFILSACAGATPMSTEPPIDNRPVITVMSENMYDNSDALYNDSDISVREVLIGNMLKEQLELNKGKDVLFRVVVELVLCGEDSDGYDWDGSQEGCEELEEIWMRKIQEREDYLYEVASKEVVPITEASEIILHIAHTDKAFVVELTAEEIDLLVKKGGFYLRLAPPKRVEGYDVRIADSFTSVLDNAQEEEMFDVIVILTIDKYNHYSGERYPSVSFKRTYNQELFEPWPISPYEFVNSEAYVPGNGMVIDGIHYEEYDRQNYLYNKMIEDYVDEVVERHGLAERRTVQEGRVKCIQSIYHMRNEPNNTSYAECISAGFDVKATKAEILALATDPDIKVIYQDYKEDVNYRVFNE